MKNTVFKPVFDAVRFWYIPLIIGILFILASIFAVFFPLISFMTLAVLFSLSFLLGGISEVIFAISNRKSLDNWGWHLATGIITLVIGLMLVANPKISANVLALFIGFAVLFRSIAHISFSIDVRNYGIKNWGYLLALGILGAVISVILILNPEIAGVTAAIMMGIAFLIIGIVSIFFSTQLRKVHKYTKKIKPAIKEKFKKIQSEITEEIRDIFFN